MKTWSRSTVVRRAIPKADCGGSPFVEAIRSALIDAGACRFGCVHPAVLVFCAAHSVATSRMRSDAPPVNHDGQLERKRGKGATLHYARSAERFKVAGRSDRAGEKVSSPML